MESKEDKAVCPHCGEVHDSDLDAMADFAEMVASQFADKAFPMIWKEVKRDIKEMKKREIAEEMFYTGAVQMLASFISMSKAEIEKREKE